MPNKRSVGQEGERTGGAFLERQGYRILDRNVRTPFGEIDLVAREGGQIVFVEVKLRRSTAFGRPEEAVNRRKQERIVKSSLYYLKSRSLRSADIRFDVLALGPGPDEVALIRSAFTAQPKYTF